jgi:uncharacterized protein
VKELVTFIAKQLATNPEQVQITESEQNGTLELRLTADEDDKGRIIGKQGKVIKAIRVLASAAGAKSDKKVMVEVD